MHTTPYFVLAKAVFLIKLANNHILLKHLGSLSPSNSNKFFGSCVYFSAVGFAAKEVAIRLRDRITVTSDNGFDVHPDAIKLVCVGFIQASDVDGKVKAPLNCVIIKLLNSNKFALKRFVACNKSEA